VADQFRARDGVDSQLESEHGILEIMPRAETVRAGIGSPIAYLLAAGIPLIVTVVVPPAVESLFILAAVVVSLIATSGIGARTGHMNLPRILARALTVGLGTMAVSYLAGTRCSDSGTAACRDVGAAHRAAGPRDRNRGLGRPLGADPL